jgi:hypothetical protein
MPPPEPASAPRLGGPSAPVISNMLAFGRVRIASGDEISLMVGERQPEDISRKLKKLENRNVRVLQGRNRGHRPAAPE